MPTREYFLVPRDDPEIKAYEKYAVEIATFLGAYKPHAEQEIRDMIDFEMEYAKVIATINIMVISSILFNNY